MLPGNTADAIADRTHLETTRRYPSFNMELRPCESAKGWQDGTGAMYSEPAFRPEAPDQAEV